MLVSTRDHVARDGQTSAISQPDVDLPVPEDVGGNRPQAKRWPNHHVLLLDPHVQTARPSLGLDRVPRKGSLANGPFAGVDPDIGRAGVG